jgi:hypothetical protein
MAWDELLLLPPLILQRVNFSSLLKWWDKAVLMISNKVTKLASNKL